VLCLVKVFSYKEFKITLIDIYIVEKGHPLIDY
jgi:hypothetical protein